MSRSGTALALDVYIDLERINGGESIGQLGKGKESLSGSAQSRDGTLGLGLNAWMLLPHFGGLLVEGRMPKPGLFCWGNNANAVARRK